MGAAGAERPADRPWRWASALALVYCAAALLGLRAAVVHPSVTAVWAPTGIAVAALLRFGNGVWPGVFAGAFAANLVTAGTVATSLSIAGGNTLEGLIAAMLIRRFAGGARAAERPADLLKLTAFGALLAAPVAASVGTGSLWLAGLVPARPGAVWLTWWLGDTVGLLLVAPALLLWTSGKRDRWTLARGVEAALMLASLVTVALAAFGSLSPPAPAHLPLEFLCLPALLWAALRFGPREASAALLALAAIAIRGTLRGAGPFARVTPDVDLLLLQAFLGVTAVTVLVLACGIADRWRVLERLRTLAERDALTGLFNYRMLVEALGAEVARSLQTGRPFAVLMLDLDGLKLINDRLGHLAGSRALVRVAEAAQACCRAIDTAARYGGDEFAVILPGANEATAWAVARRIDALLARHGPEPAVSVSIGVSECPRDGRSAAALLGAADKGLYRAKAPGRRNSL